MLTIWSKIIITFVIGLQAGVSYAGVKAKFRGSLQAKDCLNGRVRLRVFGKYKTYKSRYCTNAQRTTLISSACRTKKCNALRKFPLVIDRDSLYSEFGNPGFKLCQKLGGKAEILEFFFDKRWYKLDRCLFSSDGSYVDTGTLMAVYFQRVR